MKRENYIEKNGRHREADEYRMKLLRDLPVSEKQTAITGIPTALR